MEDLLEDIVRLVPPPKGDKDAPLQALIIDSWFDNYLGVVSLVRVVNGRLRKKQKIRIMSAGRDHLVDHVGIFTPKRQDLDSLDAGEVGYVIAGVKEIDGAPVGDTITEVNKPADEVLPGFKQVQPRVFSGLFPVAGDDYENLREALAKLRLNDAALFYEPETSTALGFGFRCGFLGLLHMEIIQERLEREYDLKLITTAPTVIFEIENTKGEVYKIENPAAMPEPNFINEIREPIVVANILVPHEYVGNVITLWI